MAPVIQAVAQLAIDSLATTSDHQVACLGQVACKCKTACRMGPAVCLDHPAFMGKAACLGQEACMDQAKWVLRRRPSEQHLVWAKVALWMTILMIMAQEEKEAA